MINVVQIWPFFENSTHVFNFLVGQLPKVLLGNIHFMYILTMYISNRNRVIHYRVLTAKPIEDRDLKGCFLYLHASSPQQHTFFFKLTKWFQIAVFIYFFQKSIFWMEAIDEEHFLYFCFVFVLQFEIKKNRY